MAVERSFDPIMCEMKKSVINITQKMRIEPPIHTDNCRFALLLILGEATAIGGVGKTSSRDGGSSGA
jgi:hypothetical protein